MRAWRTECYQLKVAKLYSEKELKEAEKELASERTRNTYQPVAPALDTKQDEQIYPNDQPESINMISTEVETKPLISVSDKTRIELDRRRQTEQIRSELPEPNYGIIVDNLMGSMSVGPQGVKLSNKTTSHIGTNNPFNQEVHKPVVQIPLSSALGKALNNLDEKKIRKTKEGGDPPSPPSSSSSDSEDSDPSESSSDSGNNGSDENSKKKKCKSKGKKKPHKKSQKERIKPIEPQTYDGRNDPTSIS